MPPKSKIYLYHVVQHDYGHHTDRKGYMSLISTHTTEAGATKAAKERLRNQYSKCPDVGEIQESTTGKDNLYHGFAHVCQDRRDNLTVQVKKMILHEDGVPIGGSVPVASGSGTNPRPAPANPSRPTPSLPTTTAAAASKKRKSDAQSGRVIEIE